MFLQCKPFILSLLYFGINLAKDWSNLKGLCCYIKDQWWSKNLNIGNQNDPTLIFDVRHYYMNGYLLCFLIQFYWIIWSVCQHDCCFHQPFIEISQYLIKFCSSLQRFVFWMVTSFSKEQGGIGRCMEWWLEFLWKLSGDFNLAEKLKKTFRSLIVDEKNSTPGSYWWYKRIFPFFTNWDLSI